MYEDFERLMKERGETFSDVARAVGGRPSTFTDWRAGRSEPSAKKLHALAVHFGVSMEYLLIGSEAGPAAVPAVDGMPLSSDELGLVRGFRKAVGPVRKAMLDMANDALEVSGARSARSAHEQTA
jgi:transcriptional regulator with XRE-family HTH domain